ncbi:MAG: tRNA pseudouridine(38-40) synthase TruA [Gemmatimonadota bacterium]
MISEGETQGEIRLLLVVHYDGTHFFGWQIQAEGRTVQGELENAVARLTEAKRTVTGAGRTDRGVHAVGQVASVTLPAKWTAGSFRKAMNAVLPFDVWIAEAREVPPAFHPRFDAVARSYEYRVGLREATDSPFHRPWCWRVEQPLSVEHLGEAAGYLKGEHSFKAFAKSGQPHLGERCRVQHAEWVPWDDLGTTLTITANRYLHHMVRYLVGTMVDIARGRRPMDDLPALLQGAGHLTTSPPAPPRGLFLSRVEYAAEAVEPGASTPRTPRSRENGA